MVIGDKWSPNVLHTGANYNPIYKVKRKMDHG